MGGLLKLSELEPHYLKSIDQSHFDWREADDREHADGIIFLCPKCFLAHGRKPEGVHCIICWEPSVAPEMRPGPGRWHIEGSGWGNLTLRGDHASSISVDGGCNAHFFVRNGLISGQLA